MNNELSILNLMQLVSPALPVGAYAYSQGLEYMIDHQWIKNQKSLHLHLQGVMNFGLVYLDLPMLSRSYEAWQQADHKRIEQLNQEIIAYRESKEFVLEDTQLGEALARLCCDLELADADELSFGETKSFICVFALAALRMNVNERMACIGFAWSWLDNQVAAATKLLPLGQTDAQRTLLSLKKCIPDLCEKASLVKDYEIGQSLMGLAIASSKHETQYSRLFRS